MTIEELANRVEALEKENSELKVHVGNLIKHVNEMAVWSDVIADRINKLLSVSHAHEGMSFFAPLGLAKSTNISQDEYNTNKVSKFTGVGLNFTGVGLNFVGRTTLG